MTPRLRLEDLTARAPALTRKQAEFYAENCMVCLAVQKHSSGVPLHVSFDAEIESPLVVWDGEVTKHHFCAYADRKKRADFGACTIALLLIPLLTGYVAVQTSPTGDGVDYYLERADAGDELIFNESARLEVSGIEEENGSNTIAARINKKKRRIQKIRATGTGGTEDMSTYICIVEFSQPGSKVVVI